MSRTQRTKPWTNSRKYPFFRVPRHLSTKRMLERARDMLIEEGFTYGRSLQRDSPPSTYDDIYRSSWREGKTLRHLRYCSHPSRKERMRIRHKNQTINIKAKWDRNLGAYVASYGDLVFTSPHKEEALLQLEKSLLEME